MTKRLLAILLSLCLLIPSVGLTFGQTVSAAGSDYVIAEIPYKVSGAYKGGSGSLFSIGTKFDPVDLTPYGITATGAAAIPSGKVALCMDVYIAGDPLGIKSLTNGTWSGQLEITSGGTCDVGERHMSIAGIGWTANEWHRCVIDLSQFITHTDDGGKSPFDPSKINYFRAYALASSGEYTISLKIRNVKFVDLTAEPLSEEEDPLGDGSFVPDAPVWKHYPVADGYYDEDTIVAGYNAADYVKEHHLTVTDWAPIFNSLIEGLATAGGGELFIPAGEYDCYSEISVLTGVSVYGEWANPDENPEIKGTILKVHEDCGAGKASGSPFITLKSDSMIKGITVWYPDQTNYANPVQYPATIGLGATTHAKNITLVNSYVGFVTMTDTTLFCPNAENIYGTPLNTGMDMDGVGDIMRLENINFAPDYWINSGLPGAPAAEEDAEALERMLYNNAIGIILRRIDWSYLAFSHVRGYQTGLMFTLSEYSADVYPNGQCTGLLLEDCQTGLYVTGISQFGEMLSNSVIRNCNNGIWIGESMRNADGSIAIHEDSALQVSKVEISANQTAIRNQQKTTLMIMSSTIHSGEVITECGWCTLTDNVFETAAPQVTLANGTLNAVLLGNRDADGKPIVVDNEGLCPMSLDDTALDVPEVLTITAEEAAFVPHKPANASHVVIADLKTDGTDVTAALQAALNDIGKTGGVLFLPTGHYRLNGSVTVPAGVELRGANDYGRMPYNAGTTLDVYATASDDPTVILSEKSGIRGIVFNYPEQYHNDLFMKEKKFTEYPFAIQGRGADIYVINVALRNAWDGIDMMTYRCDNHYIDYLGGVGIHSFIKVGGGSENGIIRNFQYNYYMMTWESMFGWATLPIESAAFKDVMNEQFNNHEDVVCCQVGDVKNELLYNNFNYAGCVGLQFVGEETGAATAKVIGHGVDYGTYSIDIQQAEEVAFVNTQLTSFNQIGDALELNMYSIRLGKDFEGTVDMVSTIMWADCTQEFRVENGTLNLYGVICHPYVSAVEMSDISGDGKIRMTNVFFKKPLITLAVGDYDGIFINGGMAYDDMTDEDMAAQYDNIQVRVDNWDAPANAQFPAGATMWFTDAFTDAEMTTFRGKGGGDATVSFKNGQATLNMGTGTAVGMMNTDMSLTGGEEDALYHLETRLNMSMFHEDGNSRAMIALYDNDNDVAYPVYFTADGKVLVNNMEIADYETDEWYRVALELDLRDGAHKTYQVVLMDDDYNEITKSAVLELPEDFQDDRVYIKQVYIGAIADKAASAGDATDRTIVKCDYVFVTRGGASGTLGDVNGDDKIDSTDARLILQYYAKKIGEDGLNTAVADVNNDGKVDSTDARLILQLYAKKIAEFSKA